MRAARPGRGAVGVTTPPRGVEQPEHGVRQLSGSSWPTHGVPPTADTPCRAPGDRRAPRTTARSRRRRRLRCHGVAHGPTDGVRDPGRTRVRRAPTGGVPGPRPGTAPARGPRRSHGRGPARSGGETLAAPLTAGLQHRLTRPGLHPVPEAVLLLPLAVVGLECALHAWPPGTRLRRGPPRRGGGAAPKAREPGESTGSDRETATHGRSPPTDVGPACRSRALVLLSAPPGARPTGDRRPDPSQPAPAELRRGPGLDRPNQPPFEERSQAGDPPDRGSPHLWKCLWTIRIGPFWPPPPPTTPSPTIATP